MRFIKFGNVEMSCSKVIKEFPLASDRLTYKKFDDSLLNDQYISWLNDKQVVKYSEQRHHKHTYKSCRAYFDSFSNSPNLFIAICLKSGEHIGNLSATVNTHNKLVDLAIMIGNRKYWGHGYGCEAFKVFVDYFLESGIARKVIAGTMEKNISMLKTLEKCGMQQEGIRKGYFLLNGTPVDLLYFSKQASDV